MNYPYFAKLQEFIITGSANISAEIADKLYQFHIMPMQPVRETLGVWLTASEHSGYRPRQWELKKGRSGNSEHTFTGKGAVDWTCKDFVKNKSKLLELIIKHTSYTRICIYDGFIHCDYKLTKSEHREVYTSNSKSQWKFSYYC